MYFCVCFFFKQKTAYEMRISDWSSDVCSSDLAMARALDASELAELIPVKRYALAAIFIRSQYRKTLDDAADLFIRLIQNLENTAQQKLIAYQLENSKRADALIGQLREILQAYQVERSEENTSELQTLMS